MEKYLIVGLGNIGTEYKHTRHNIGFMQVDYVAQEHGVNFDSDRLAFQTSFKLKGRNVYMIKPTTYMNLSGKALRYWMGQLKISPKNILVIVDDIALPFGALRMKARGSSAGHNGLKDIEAVLGNNVYPRLRFGIGDNYSKGKQVEYVLGDFTTKEKEDLASFLEKGKTMIEAFVLQGIDRTMNMYNS